MLGVFFFPPYLWQVYPAGLFPPNLSGFVLTFPNFVSLHFDQNGRVGIAHQLSALFPIHNSK